MTSCTDRFICNDMALVMALTCAPLSHSRSRRLYASVILSVPCHYLGNGLYIILNFK